MAPKMQLPQRGGRWLIRGIDWLVRRFKGVVEFDNREFWISRLRFVARFGGNAASDGSGGTSGGR